MNGVGIYMRHLQKRIHQSPKQAAKKATDHGISFVAIMGAWQQPRKGGKVKVATPNTKTLAAYTDAFLQAGVGVGLWFYPWAGHESELLDALNGQVEKMSRCDFLLNDAELGYKYKRRRAASRGQAGTNMRGVQPEAIRDVAPPGSKAFAEAAARLLVDGQRDLAGRFNMREGVGHTAYGVAGFHPNYPWEIFLDDADWCSPQLYTATARQVDQGIEQWYARSHDDSNNLRNDDYMLPSIGAYGRKSGTKMHEHLSSFVDANEGVDGFITWSWRQLNGREWDVLARWSDWLEKGACGL